MKTKSRASKRARPPESRSADDAIEGEAEERRRQRNRDSAARSREKKRVQLKDLELKVQTLTAENQALNRTISELLAKNALLTDGADREADAAVSLSSAAGDGGVGVGKCLSPEELGLGYSSLSGRSPRERLSPIIVASNDDWLRVWRQPPQAQAQAQAQAQDDKPLSLEEQADEPGPPH